MSLVEIVEHDEVIFTILDKPPPPPPRTPRYESALERQLKQAKTEKRCRTMGYAETPLSPPEEYLKKGKGIRPPINISTHACAKGNLPPVPRLKDIPKPIERPMVNFRVVNIMKAIKSKPKPLEPRLVDTRDGHIKKLDGSGEIPQYSKRPDFGQMPKYLLRANRKKWKEEQRIKREYDQRESLCKLISAEERNQLLQDLKTNWQLMQKAFLQLPMLTDTIPKMLKKTKMELDLKQLEKDIDLVDSNPYIYVYE